MIVACPVCRKKTEWEGNPFRPFCSERCKLMDLGAWATEGYRVPVDRRDEDGDMVVLDWQLAGLGLLLFGVRSWLARKTKV